MTACYLVYRTLLLLPGGGVENCYDSRYPTLLKYLLDGHVVFLRAYERQDPPLAVLSLVAFENILCPLGKWHTYHIRTLPLGLAGYILHRVIYNVGRSKAHKIGYAAAYAAMEYEDVTLDCKRLVGRQVKIRNAVAFFKSYVVRCAVMLRGLTFVFHKRIVGGKSFLNGPVEECAQTGEYVYYGIVAFGERTA